MSDEIVNNAAALLDARDFEGTIRYVHSNEHLLTDDSRVPALMQAFYAADVAGLEAEARVLARRIAVDEPRMPSIQPYLK
jgi:hypothetical protein